jgi:hypothetical protein
MEETEAVEEQAAATPIFAIYRRGYDPEQVDRYVLDQQRRLDEATHRASESERKLAAAVGQLRELHRRVAVYESEQRSSQPPQLDTLGERVQRILQEAWEGAYNLRQEAERDVNEMREAAQSEVDALREKINREVDELRQVASKEAADVVDEATRRALHIRDETERRRQAYLERVERDREQAISQITYLYDQRQCAIAELARLQASVQTTIEEMVRSPLGRPAPGVMDAAVDSALARRGPKEDGPMAELPPTEVSDGKVSEEGEAEESSERYVRPSDVEVIRAGRHSVDEEAADMERVMRSTQPPPAVSSRQAAPVPPEVSMPQAHAMETAPGMPEPAVPRLPGFEGARSAERRPSRPRLEDGLTGDETAAYPTPGASGSPATRQARASDFPGPVQPRGVIGGGPAEPRQGVAQSVQAGLEAAKGMLRRPRPQGVYDAEQDGWTG